MKCLVAIASLAVLAPLAASAQDTTYNYTGASMSGSEVGSFIGPNGSGATYSYCCTTMDGTMTLSSSLAPNLNDAVVDPLSLTFNFSTIGGPVGAPAGNLAGGAISGMAGGPSGTSTPGGIAEYGSGTASALILNPAGVTVSTNSSGQITAWDLSYFTDVNGIPPNPLAGYPGEFSGQTTTSGDSLSYDGGSHGPFYTLSSGGAAGSWVMAPPAAAPEINGAGAISALTLLAGMIAVADARRRRA